MDRNPERSPPTNTDVVQTDADVVPTDADVVRFGSFEFDPVTGELWRESEPVPLQQQPARLLALLIARAGELVSRDEIRRHLWSDAAVDAEAGVNFAVRRIRAALGEEAASARFVETLPRKGYRFVAEIESRNGRGTPWRPAALRRWRPLGAAGILLAATVASLELSPRKAADLCGHPAARDAYLRGDYLLRQATDDALGRAAVFFRRAIDEDPSCALAYVGLAKASRTSLDATTRAGLLTQALEIEPSLATAQLEMGWTEFLRRRIEPAIRSFEKALALAPDLAEAYYGSALTHSALGQTEVAVTRIDQALQLDPASTAVAGDAALVLYWAGEVERAVAQFERSIELEPERGDLRWAAMHYLIDAGRYHLAAEQARESRRLYGRPPGGPWDSSRAEVEDYLRKVQEFYFDSERTDPPPAGSMIETYLGLGEPEKALAWLEKAVEEDWYGLHYLGVDPRFDPLRGESAFHRTLERLGLADHRFVSESARPR